MAHLSVIERMIAGDISYDSMGLLDQTHVRFYSPASAFKTFLDAGWLPHLQDQYRVEVPQTHFAAKIVEAAQLLGLPAETAVRNLGCYQMVIVCRKWAMEPLRGAGPSAPPSVIVPVNRPWQYELNIARSPGLKEIDAEIIPVQERTALPPPTPSPRSAPAMPGTCWCTRTSTSPLAAASRWRGCSAAWKRPGARAARSALPGSRLRAAPMAACATPAWSSTARTSSSTRAPRRRCRSTNSPSRSIATRR
ncbi:hypothetical protein FSC37_01995 [Piscinibacter aquaticus]|uniref:Uncharacterized protein n=1 Tax=Piscinibacter aquaticus TaxID=392597 RepID=A0A5C6TXR4_9BURK|nr:hypothetical protein FSC37_01995 [Piscinibacter aquaticus]